MDLLEGMGDELEAFICRGGGRKSVTNERGKMMTCGQVHNPVSHNCAIIHVIHL